MTQNPLAPMNPILPPTPGSSSPFPGAPPAPGSTRFRPIDPVRILRQHAWLLGLSAVVGLILGAFLYVYLLKAQPVYTSEAKLLVTDGLTEPYEGPQDVEAIQQQRLDVLAAFIKNQTIRIKSQEVFRLVLNNPEVRATNWAAPFITSDGTLDEARARAQLDKELTVEHIRGSTLIRVSMSSTGESKRKDLQKVLQVVVDRYLEQLRLENDNKSTDVRRWFVEEVKRTDADLVKIQEDIKWFTVTNDLPSLETHSNEATIAYNMLADQAAKLEVALESARESYEGLAAARAQGQMSHTPQELAEVEADPAVQSRDEKLRQLREQRDVFLYRFGENHRAVREIDRQTLATEAEKKKEIERLLREREAVALGTAKAAAESYEAQLVGLQPKLDEARGRMRDLSLKIQEYQRYETQRQVAAERRAKADELLNSVRIRNERPDNVRVVAVYAGTVPELTFPRLAPTVLAPAVLLVLVVTGLVFMKELIDQRVRSPQDVRLLLAGVDLLGIVPDSADDPSGPQPIEGVVNRDPTGLIAEAFRLVRATVLNQMDRRGFKTLMVVSAQSGSGVSAVVSNLAVSVAQQGRRVLVMDTNLRRPAQHMLFGTPDTPVSPGLVEVLAGKVSLQQALNRHEVPAVDVLRAGSGTQTAPEVFESSAFSDMMVQLEASYDLILLDAPPALVASDAQLLTRHVDAIAVVVRAGGEKRGMVNRMLRQLQIQRAEVLGVVLNAVRSDVGGYFRQSYEQFYQYRTPTRLPAATATAKA